MKQTIYEEIQRMNLLSRYDNSKTLSEQTTESLMADTLHNAVSGAGTDPEAFSNEILKIRNAQELALVNAELKKLSSNLDIAGWINDDFDNQNLDDVKKISDHLKKIGVNNSYEVYPNNGGFKQNTFKILTTPVTNPWDKFPCVKKHPKAKESKLTDGSSAYLIDGVYYYNNGRKKLADGTMANYTCNDPEFKAKAVQKKVAIPTELKDVEGVKKFQDWLDVNAPGWATGYKDGIINKGQNGGGYGAFGGRTQKAWASNKTKYLGAAPAAAAPVTPAAAAPVTPAAAAPVTQTAPGPDDDVR